MRYEEMLVETPVALVDIEDRNIKPGHETENQCTYCGRADDDPWFPIADVTVIRIWTSASHWAPDATGFDTGGKWQWLCREHLAGRRSWAPNSHLAPSHLLPEIHHDCERLVFLKEKCGERAVEQFDTGWFCEPHAAPERLKRREAEVLGED